MKVFEIKKWSQTFLNMPIRGEIPKDPSLQQFWKPKTAKSYETNLNRYFCTDFIDVGVKKISLKKKLKNCCKFRKFAKWPQTSLSVPIRWEIQQNSSLPNLQIFEICKTVPKIAKRINLSRNMKKNPHLTNLQILEIRKIVPKITECADSWRNT